MECAPADTDYCVSRGGLQLDLSTPADEDNVLSWRHGDRSMEAQDSQLWSPTRLLQKSFWSTLFRSAPLLPTH